MLFFKLKPIKINSLSCCYLNRYPWRTQIAYKSEFISLAVGLWVYIVFNIMFSIMATYLHVDLSFSSLFVAFLVPIPTLFAIFYKLSNFKNLSKILGFKPTINICDIFSGFIFTLLVGNFLTILWQKLLFTIGIESDAEQSLIIFARSASLQEFIFMAFCVVMYIPIFEEIIFRRLIFGVLLKIGTLPAILLSSFIFSVVHFFLLGMPILTLMGIVLQIQFLKTRNLWNPIITHGLINLFSIIGVFIQKYYYFS